MDYANTTNVEFIVDPKVLFHGWLIYSYLQIFKLIKCKWLPGECTDWFFDNIMTWSYCLHKRYSMSQQKNSISINEHALKREPVPLNHLTCENSPLSKLLAAWDVSSYETTLVVRSEEKRLFSQAINHLFSPSQIRDRSLFITGGQGF